MYLIYFFNPVVSCRNIIERNAAPLGALTQKFIYIYIYIYSYLFIYLFTYNKFKPCITPASVLGLGVYLKE